MKKKIAASVVIVSMVMSLCAGCSGKDEPSAAKDKGKEEIVYWNIGTENPDKDILKYAVDKFNEKTNSGYHVTSEAIQNDTYKEKLVISMSADECPDVYVTWVGGPMKEYIEAGYAQPIQDLMDASPVKDRIIDSAIEQSSYNGELYAFPFMQLTISGVFYNKEIFEQYNLEVPQTVSQLEQVCDTLVENGITPFALANASKWTGSMYFMSLATRKGGLEPIQKAVDGSGTFEDESFEYAGEKIQEWVKKGYFPEGVNSLSEDDGQAKQLLYQESAAMFLGGSWNTGTFKSDNEEFYKKIGWFSFPAVDGSDADASIQIGTSGYFVSFNCEDEKLKAAFEICEYYYDDEIIEKMVEENKIPPVKNAGELIKDPVVKQILEAANKASNMQIFYDQYMPPTVAEVHKDTCQQIFGLAVTPQEANATLQEAMQTYLKENKEE